MRFCLCNPDGEEFPTSRPIDPEMLDEPFVLVMKQELMAVMKANPW
jgi:hypothetical protein